jgi:Pregnancy-associated plasma protein-A
MLLDVRECRLGRLAVALDGRALPIARDAVVPDFDLHHVGGVRRFAGDHERLGQLDAGDSGGDVHCGNPNAEQIACWAGGPSLFDVDWSGGGAMRGGEREPSAWKDPPIGEAPTVVRRAGRIPVYFHVFTDGAVGNLTNQQIQKQMNILNSNFAGLEGGDYTGFSFTLAGVERIDNANWFYNLGYGSPVEREAKAATHVGDARTLNVWTTNGPGYFGFATFPSMYKRVPQLDGIVLDYNTFPGGAYGERFSLGKTATHETGHWLGLLHTFQGGCNDKGDYVEDTPDERSPASRCPVGLDTCPTPGDDPIHNYMDYSDDFCYDQFTAGQTARMQQFHAYFRADGGTSVGQ